MRQRLIRLAGVRRRLATLGRNSAAAAVGSRRPQALGTAVLGTAKRRLLLLVLLLVLRPGGRLLLVRCRLLQGGRPAAVLPDAVLRPTHVNDK